MLDFSRFTGLKKMEIGDGCFGNVRELKLVGLGELESVEIGMSSFVSSSGVFTLQRCGSLTELTIGHSSFGGYHEIVLDGVPVLETISVGNKCFSYSSLELKGENGCVSSWQELPALKRLSFGSESFRNCNRAVFESSGG